jgi:hypothetical protein
MKIGPERTGGGVGVPRRERRRAGVGRPYEVRSTKGSANSPAGFANGVSSEADQCARPCDSRRGHCQHSLLQQEY